MTGTTMAKLLRVYRWLIECDAAVDGLVDDVEDVIIDLTDEERSKDELSYRGLTIGVEDTHIPAQAVPTPLMSGAYISTTGASA